MSYSKILIWMKMKSIDQDRIQLIRHIWIISIHCLYIKMKKWSYWFDFRLLSVYSKSAVFGLRRQRSIAFIHYIDFHVRSKNYFQCHCDHWNWIQDIHIKIYIYRDQRWISSYLSNLMILHYYFSISSHFSHDLITNSMWRTL